MTVVLVTGTPGTGKTTLARMLTQRLRLRYLDVSALIARKRIADGYDAKRHCHIVDTVRLGRALRKETRTNDRVVIDSHLSHYLESAHADLCIVTKCSLKELKRRLETRGYDAAKVRENLDAEIFDVCRQEALERGHRVLAVRTTRGISDASLRRIAKALRGTITS